MAWAPKYGLKGMIDASLRVQVLSSSGVTNEKIMPLEFKTGKATSGQASSLLVKLFFLDGPLSSLMLVNIKIVFNQNTFVLAECCLKQALTEHSAQLILYTLLLSERYILCFSLFSARILVSENILADISSAGQIHAED